MSASLRPFPSLRSNRVLLSATPPRLGWLSSVADHERTDPEALRARYARDGYLYFKRLIDPDRVMAFRRYYFDILADTGLLDANTDPIDGIAGPAPDAALVRRLLFDVIVPSPEYEALCRCPELVDFFSGFLGGDVHLHKRKLIRHQRLQDTWTTPAHYDLVYLRGGTDQLCSAWIPLGDVPLEQGGLTYLEGSHVWCEQFDRTATKKMVADSITFDLPALAQEHDARWLVADYAAGDVVIHSPYIVHAALDVTDAQNHMRLSTDIRYQRVQDPIDARWQHHWRDDDGL
jgi:ectoine hydroxylase-related dioxygenase (phytanoyl-CoA dioxygenase family)